MAKIEVVQRKIYKIHKWPLRQGLGYIISLSGFGKRSIRLHTAASRCPPCWRRWPRRKTLILENRDINEIIFLSLAKLFFSSFLRIRFYINILKETNKVFYFSFSFYVPFFLLPFINTALLSQYLFLKNVSPARVRLITSL